MDVTIERTPQGYPAWAESERGRRWLAEHVAAQGWPWEGGAIVVQGDKRWLAILRAMTDVRLGVGMYLRDSRHKGRTTETGEDEHLYLDDGISGAESDKRPGYMRLRADLKPKPTYQVLVMSEESRLGRHGIDTIEVCSSQTDGTERLRRSHGQDLQARLAGAERIVSERSDSSPITATCCDAIDFGGVPNGIRGQTRNGSHRAAGGVVRED